MTLLTAPIMSEISKTSSPLYDYQSAKLRKSQWPVSFVLAGLVHTAVLLGGGYAFIQSPEYGIQGSAASMEVYMVAARPDVSPRIAAKPVRKEKVLNIPTGKSEMAMPKPPEAKRENKGKENEPAKISRADQTRHESKVKGDGSSVVPGQSATTFFSRGASEIAGKPGKYQNPPPQYPGEALRNGWQGVVVVKAFIEKEGKPSKVLVEKGSGYHALDRAALDAIKDWRFEAGHIGNITISSWVQIPIRFVLENQK